MRILTLFCFFLTTCTIPTPPSPRPAEPDRVRNVPVCVVNDADALVDNDVIRQTFDRVTEAYRQHVGIVFTEYARVETAFEPSGWAMDTAFFLGEACPRNTELRFVFTNREVHRADASMTKAEDDAQMAGVSHPYFGFVVLYSSEERWIAKNAAGDPALPSTLMHELGHVFGLEDSQDKQSFMYFASNASQGNWTADAMKGIRREKWRRWWPHR